MNCKNCEIELVEENNFCNNCGAKVVNNRITLKQIRKDFFNDVLGWDNKYFSTIKTFLIHPEIVVKSYLEGTRKKFIAPLTFLAIGVGLITLVLNSFSNEYAELNSAMISEASDKNSFDFMQRLDKEKPESYFDSAEYNNKYIEYRDTQIKFRKKMNKVTVQYFNILTLLLMPFYTFIAFLTYGRKRYNYGEHLVINSYLQGFSMISVLLFFGLSFLTSPRLYPFTILVTIFYYILVYKKILEISWVTSFLKLLKFLGILLITCIVLFIIAIIIGVFMAALKG